MAVEAYAYVPHPAVVSRPGAPASYLMLTSAGQADWTLDPAAATGPARFVRSNATLAIGALDGGFVMPTLRVLTDHEIFRRARRLRRPRRYREAAPSSATGALTLGDYVVHLEHGIGIYRGIETITAGESTLEVAIVEYEGGDRLNVPLYSLDQLERYRAAGEDDDRDHAGEDRAVDEKAREPHNTPRAVSSIDCIGTVSKSTAAPGRIRCNPRTTTLSLADKPSRTTRMPCSSGPSLTGRYVTLPSSATTQTNLRF